MALAVFIPEAELATLEPNFFLPSCGETEETAAFHDAAHDFAIEFQSMAHQEESEHEDDEQAQEQAEQTVLDACERPEELHQQYPERNALERYHLSNGMCFQRAHEAIADCQYRSRVTWVGIEYTADVHKAALFALRHDLKLKALYRLLYIDGHVREIKASALARSKEVSDLVWLVGAEIRGRKLEQTARYFRKQKYRNRAR